MPYIEVDLYSSKIYILARFHNKNLEIYYEYLKENKRMFLLELVKNSNCPSIKYDKDIILTNILADICQ